MPIACFLMGKNDLFFCAVKKFESWGFPSHFPATLLVSLLRALLVRLLALAH